MRYPTLTELNTGREMVDTFLGYDHTDRIGSGEFYDMRNLTGDRYPILSQREGRKVISRPAAAAGLIAKDALCYVDGSAFRMGEYRVEMGLAPEESGSMKQLVSMGAYVIILPDRKYINTRDLSDYGNLDAETVTEGNVRFSLCKYDASDYNVDYIQPSAPEAPANMELWLDTSAVPNALKQWSQTSQMWVSIGTTYVKISSPGIGKAFAQYDGVSISGLSGTTLHDAESGEALLSAKDLEALDGTAIVYAQSDDYLVIVGVLDQVYTISDSVTICRKMPEMDFVTESGNRLWGCRYGLSAAGETVNEIYASKLGDFKNWNCFMGASTDSYAASVGTDGPFTGAVTHLGYPLFFKENCVHKVYGSYPAAFQIQDTACRGVQKGCSRSLAIVGETLYYKSRHGVCAFDGSLPTEISAPLGETAYRNAVGGASGSKYDLSMASDEEQALFCYDAERRLWFREDDLKVSCFCTCDGTAYAIDSTGAILAMTGGTETISWMAETGDLGLSSPDSKYVSRLVLRLLLEPKAELKILVRYDFSEDWETLGVLEGVSLRSFSVPVRPRRCDHFRLRLEGTGVCRVYSITKTVEEGSETP